MVDLLGNGTACLVWSSPLPGDARRPMRYVDLMGGQKPHLLVTDRNNLGAETHVHYAPSTQFYLAGQGGRAARGSRACRSRCTWSSASRPYDRISRNRFVTRYAYHHGYFDGVEREFRGFGMVEQWDTEEFADARRRPMPRRPPTSTLLACAAGADADLVPHRRVSSAGTRLAATSQAARRNDTGEYYREPGSDDDASRKLLLDDTILPPGLTRR